MTARIDFTLPIALVSELKKSVPKWKRSDFVADAVEEKLKSIKREKAFKELRGIWDKSGGVKFSTDKELSDWRRNLWSQLDKRTNST